MTYIETKEIYLCQIRITNFCHDLRRGILDVGQQLWFVRSKVELVKKVYISGNCSTVELVDIHYELKNH